MRETYFSIAKICIYVGDFVKELLLPGTIQKTNKTVRTETVVNSRKSANQVRQKQTKKSVQTRLNNADDLDSFSVRRARARW